MNMKNGIYFESFVSIRTTAYPKLIFFHDKSKLFFQLKFFKLTIDLTTIWSNPFASMLKMCI